MTHLPVPVRLALRRLARRLTLGVFLEVWPTYAAVGIVLAGLVALVCRLFVPAAGPHLWWLWLTPIAAMAPAWLVCRLRAYTQDQLVALADSLSGGDGLLLATVERPGTEWAGSARLSRIADRPLPALRASRRWPVVVLAATFLAAMLLLPQRQSAAASTRLANHIADDVAASVAELKARQVLTAAEEKKLEEEIVRLRKGAAARMDDASWEAADGMKERLAADLAAKRDAVTWAQESLARFAAARAGGAADAQRSSSAAAGELSEALAQLAKAGMLEGAPAELKDLASGDLSMPTDAAALAKLADALGKYLGGRRGDLARAASGLRGERFDPDEFQLADAGEGVGNGEGEDPGRGGVNRGRADAPLTWGDETIPFDRFKAQALPPGAARGPDDWAPVVQLPGAPRPSSQVSTPSTGRAFSDTAGQEAWRRSLAPRHQRAVRTYFDGSAGSKGTRPADTVTGPTDTAGSKGTRPTDTVTEPASDVTAK